MTDTVTGAEFLASMLVGWDFGPVFHVPGEGILELLDAFADLAPKLPLVSCRHEGGMAYMAQAVGQFRRRPGICLAGRAPGALNTALALHTAWTDASPLLLVIGQPHDGQEGREAFLGSEFEQAFGPMAKWIGQCRDAARLPELLSRAWSLALGGQMGPAVLVVSEAVWKQEVPQAPLMPAPIVPAQSIGADDASAIADMLSSAKRPLLIVGGTGWSDEGVDSLAALATASGLPVATSYRRRDLMPAAHAGFIGEVGIGADPRLLAKIGAADVIVVAGMRLGEINTFGASTFEGYRLLDVPQPDQTLVHVHPDATELNRVYRCTLPVCARGESLIAKLQGRLVSERLPDWSDWREALRADRETFTRGKTCPGPLDMREVCRVMRRQLPDDAVLAVGAGAYAQWPQRYFSHDRYRTQIGPKSGAMGYGLPAAIGIKAAFPDRCVVAMAGDGCFMMHGEELATAVLYRLPIIAIVVNNSCYGAIAATQKRHFGRSVGTDLSPIDFAAYAEALGARGIRVHRTEEFEAAFRSALASDGPVLIELVTGPEAMRPQ